MKRGPLTPIFDAKPRRGTINPGVMVSGETGPCTTVFQLHTSQWRDAATAEARSGVYGNGYFYVWFAQSLAIVDVAAAELVSFTIFSQLRSASVDYGAILSPSGNHLYLCGANFVDGSGLYTIDVSDPTAPFFVGLLYDPIDLPNTSLGGVRDGNYLYVSWITVSSQYHLAIIDVSVESAPALVTQFLHTDGQTEVALIDGGLMFTRPDSFVNEGLHAIYDLPSPTTPVLLGTYDLLSPSYAEAMVRDGDLLWVAGGGFVSGSVGSVDISDPTDAFQVGIVALDPLTSMQYADGDGDIMVAGYNGAIAVADLVDGPRRPRAIGSLSDALLGSLAAIHVEGSWAYVACSTRVLTVNLAVPSAPVIGSSHSTNMSGSGNFDFVKAGNYLFVPSGNNDRLNIYDVTNPAAMTQVSSVSDARYDNIRASAVIGNYCFLVGATATGPFTVVDVTTKSAPVIVYSLSDAVFASSLSCAAVYDHIYIGGDTSIVIVDVSSPTSPVVVGTFTTPFLQNQVRNFERNGNVLWVSQYTTTALIALDVSNPSNPILLSETAARAEIYGLHASGDYLYEVQSDFGLDPCVRSLKVADPTNPLFVGATSNYPIEWANNLALGDPGVLYVAEEANEFFLWKLDISDPDYPTVAAYVAEAAAVQGQTNTAFDNGELINMSDMGLTVTDSSLNVLRRFQSAATWGIEGWVLDGDRLYTVAGLTVSITDVSDAHHPVVLGERSIPGLGVPDNAATIRTLTGDLSYQDGKLAVFSEATRGTIYLFDVSGSTPVIIGTYVITTADTGGFDDFTEGCVVIDGDYLYLRPSEWLFVFDISDPANITLVGQIPNDDNIGFQSAPNMMWKRGDYLFTVGEDRSFFVGRLIVIDVSDPANPFTAYTLVNDSAFDSSSEAGLLDDNILYITNNQRLTAVNINNPLAPAIVGTLTSSQLGFPWDISKGGDHIYVVNGVAVRRVNVANPTAMSIDLSYTASLPSTVPAQGYGENIKYIDGVVYFGATYGPASELPFSQRGTVWMLNEACI
jgi:hypothetical protein